MNIKNKLMWCRDVANMFGNILQDYKPYLFSIMFSWMIVRYG